MSSNSVTGDALRTRAQSKQYDEGFDRIFGKKGKKNDSVASGTTGNNEPEEINQPSQGTNRHANPV